VHRFQLRLREGRAHAGKVDRLPARHPAHAGCAGEQRASAAGIGQAAVGQDTERERLQGVAGQERHGFPESDMAGRLAAAQHVVVHAGKVIVNE
jgi:hypothetical protein